MSVEVVRICENITIIKALSSSLFLEKKIPPLLKDGEHTNRGLPGDQHPQRELWPPLLSEGSSLCFYRGSPFVPGHARVPYEPVVWAHPEGIIWQYLDMIDAISVYCR